MDMNNTEHVCYFTIFSGGQFTDLESTVAYLSILVIRDFSSKFSMDDHSVVLETSNNVCSIFSESSTHVVMITHTCELSFCSSLANCFCLWAAVYCSDC